MFALFYMVYMENVEPKFWNEEFVNPSFKTVCVIALSLHLDMLRVMESFGFKTDLYI